ncbi:MAG TPA: DEAD/DEAH box helicase [Steroidobacteraceae bacterium]|nr:DEAD/DEAH box helicase [Steroidobacteraceae bacterium]
MPLPQFHPAVQAWFSKTFPGGATPAQLDAWPAIAAGGHALIAAPTGSGKTLAAFLAAIDSLAREGADGRLTDATRVVYVSPLKALSNDVNRNLELPLAGVSQEMLEHGSQAPVIRAAVRTGDTTQTERAMMRRVPPHILVTTPESLYLLLTSTSGREMLRSVRTVIVDEIHAVAQTKRGAHLALTLERLVANADQPVQRIGLSATQKPIEEVARFLLGTVSGEAVSEGRNRHNSSPPAQAQQTLPLDESCLLRSSDTTSSNVTIINSGHVRERDIGLVMPAAPLEAVMSGEVWATVYDQLATLIDQHHTTLIFANTRRMVERVSRHLAERLGEDNVAAHHGSLSKETRFDAEQRLKAGKLKVMVATASLELGIDIGDVELVCQLGTPRSISVFLQRVGRANHSVGGVPKGRIFPSSRDELIDCTALLDSVRRGELDRLHIPEHPLDVLSQQIVAEVAAREYGEDELFDLVRRAYSYRNLERKDFDAVVRMLAEGIDTKRGRRGTYLHRDAVNKRLRARKSARLTAITCGGAIPDNADYQVILEPAGIFVGTLNEDFAIESLAGDVFQLGNTSYKVLRVEAGRVRVEDAKGQPPSLPFWLGEAPARTAELSASVSRLREDIEALLPEVTADTIARAIDVVEEKYRLPRPGAHQLVEYLAGAKAVLGKLPTLDTLVFERFFDESGGQQLIIHAPFGARINRAFGLSLRKKFCRTFNFELQAAATEDAIILSLGETHSFELASVARFLNSKTVEDTLIQAMLDSPMFTARWRWNASISLAIRRSSGGKRTPPQVQRMASEDLIAVLFPDQIACAENLSGPREIPDHPLVKQTLQDCLHEAMDIDGLRAVLVGLETGAIDVVARDLPQPSPLAAEILTARPYSYLDDAPLEERRTNAVAQRRWLDPESAADMGKLDPAAIKLVREQAWPEVTNADELHDALHAMGVITADEGRRENWARWLDELIDANRATRLTTGASTFWTCAECLPLIQAVYPQSTLDPVIAAPAEKAEKVWQREAAITDLVRGRLQGLGPVTARDLVDSLALTPSEVSIALIELESEGFVLRGRFTEEATAPEAVHAGDATLEWCERRLLARINRYTIKTLRAEIEPVSGADFMRFLFEWQGITRQPKPEGVESLDAVIKQLEGYEVPAAAWESDVLAARLHDYDPHWLDSLCLSGRALWARLTPAKSLTAAPVRTTPIALITRRHWSLWNSLAAAPREEVQLSHGARALHDYFLAHGASFFDDLVSGTTLLRSQAETALGELVSAGLVNADSYSGLRALLIPSDKKRQLVARRRRIALFGLEDAGRWSLVRKSTAKEGAADTDALEQIAEILLRRYGVVFRKVLEREADWLPPWHTLLRVFRRLEAQGKIRGGRFVNGMAGEQYALPDAVASMRAIRKLEAKGDLVSLSAADPLNLTGIVTPGARVPALTKNRVLYRDGVPVATHAAGQSDFLVQLEPGKEWEARQALLRKSIVAGSARPS